MISSIIEKFFKKKPSLLLLDKNSYERYGTFITENFEHVSRGFYILLPDRRKIYFQEIVKININVAKELLWKKFIDRNSKVYILFNGRELIGFAVMEPEGILSYLFIDEKYRKKGFGTFVLDFFKDNYQSFIVRIEEDKHQGSLPQFYKKNGFEFVGECIKNNMRYFEYKYNSISN